MSSRIKGAPWISLTTAIGLSIVLTVVRVGDTEGKVLFSDDFENGNLGQWEAIGGADAYDPIGVNLRFLL